MAEERGKLGSSSARRSYASYASMPFNPAPLGFESTSSAHNPTTAEVIKRLQECTSVVDNLVDACRCMPRSALHVRAANDVLIDALTASADVTRALLEKVLALQEGAGEVAMATEGTTTEGTATEGTCDEQLDTGVYQNKGLYHTIAPFNGPTKRRFVEYVTNLGNAAAKLLLLIREGLDGDRLDGDSRGDRPNKAMLASLRNPRSCLKYELANSTLIGTVEMLRLLLRYVLCTSSACAVRVQCVCSVRAVCVQCACSAFALAREATRELLRRELSRGGLLGVGWLVWMVAHSAAPAARLPFSTWAGGWCN